METSNKTAPFVSLLALCLAALSPAQLCAKEVDSSVAACLKAWGENPFGANPQYRTYGTSIKVFGIGNDIEDTKRTSAPELVLIEPSVNLMGASTIELLNPNGWYCMRTTVSLLGRVHIRAHCKAHLAATSAGATAVGNTVDNRYFRDLSVTSIGSVSVERPCD